MKDLAVYYAVGAVVVGALLIVDSLVLLRRKGAFYANPDGKAVGWSFVFMIIESYWTGASVLALVNAVFVSTRDALLPAFYLLPAGFALLRGIYRNRTEGPVFSVPLWEVRMNLAFCAAFMALAISEVLRFRT